MARSYNGLGLVATDEGLYQEAVRLFEQSAESARAAGDAAGVARAIGNMGLPLQELGDLGRARRNFQLLRDVGRQLGDARLEGNGLANEASIDIWEGDPGPAIARLDTARLIYRRIDYATGEQNALGQLATAYELTGEFNRAFASLDSSLVIARAQGLLFEEAEALRLTADLHGQVGDWRRAIRLYEQVDSLFREGGFESSRAAALRGSANAFLALDNQVRARADAQEALRLHASFGEVVEELDDLTLLAEIEARGDAAGAIRYLDSAAVVANGLNTRGARLSVLLARARLADMRRDSRGVLEVVSDASADVTEGDYWAQWEAYALAARAYQRLSVLDSAALVGRRAVAAVERVRAELGSETMRTTFGTERADVYSDLVLVLLQQGRTDESFAVADAARSRGLLDHLSAARGGSGLAELAGGVDLLRRIDQLVERLRATEPRGLPERAGDMDSTVQEVVRELDSARSEYEAILTAAERRSPRAVALLGTAAPRLDDIRAALSADEILLEYLVTSNDLIIFAIRRDGLRVLDEPTDGETLGYRVGLLRGLWGTSSGDWRRGLPVSRALHETLIEPVRRAGLLDDSIAHILVVPHGALGRLPFASLNDGASGAYLARDYSVTYLPSAAALPVLRGVDPASRPLATGGDVFAPFPDELPSTASEADAFRRAIPGGRAHRGAAATEAALREALASERLVHVATHGTLNARNPMFSRVELARPRTPRAARLENDGRLEVHEVLGLIVRSPLVFFSGCETGTGQPWTDDPVRGTADHTLAQALLSAGAANVISTLWRIDDAGAAEFARLFYSHLAREPVSGALVSAQREMADDPRYASPYFWASYALSGEGRFAGPQSATTASVSISEGPQPSGPSFTRNP